MSVGYSDVARYCFLAAGRAAKVDQLQAEQQRSSSSTVPATGSFGWQYNASNGVILAGILARGVIDRL